ncbi:DUF1688 family protein [Alkalinema pantanalense CENA528]|uniref:DUF1688 family protein n=1 Tax=Alkalinema pantanalense TaxID=1620705 RepID=UPI003D6F5AA3
MVSVSYLRSPHAIREQAHRLLELGLADRLYHFQVDLTRLDAVADSVIETMQRDYPDGNIPFHSRWRHFPAERVAQALQGLEPLERAKAQFDLVIPSVLLDAGAGGAWHYRDGEGRIWQRSEGLAVASLDLFCQGKFSQTGDLTTDALGLTQLSLNDLAAGLQVSETNPIVGLEGRWQILQKLGHLLARSPQCFGSDRPRLGNLVDYFHHQAIEQSLSAVTIFQTLLESLSDLWPERCVLEGQNLGDVWAYTPRGALANDRTEVAPLLVPLHKLSQWLTYSLLEPLMELGLQMIDLDQLTGLAEYRNGGLCLDLGLLRLKQAQDAQRTHAVVSALVVEWRALTIALLDLMADRIRQKLQKTVVELPLAKILQGGTWSAGRTIAQTRRPDGSPPILIESDGTVF